MSYPSIRWPKFGTFKVRRGKIKDSEQLKAYDEFRSKTSKKYINYLKYIKDGNEEKADKSESTSSTKSDKQ